MLTYDFQNTEGPLYLFVYNCLKQDIISGKIKAGEKLPSKRSFANNNGISTITIQNAYDQLASEGYIFTLPKRGYYVSEISRKFSTPVKRTISYDIRTPSEQSDIIYDFSNNGTDPDNFPGPGDRSAITCFELLTSCPEYLSPELCPYCNSPLSDV